jgi:hypothetical protein
MGFARRGDVEGLRAYLCSDAFNGLDPQHRRAAMRSYASRVRKTSWGDPIMRAKTGRRLPSSLGMNGFGLHQAMRGFRLTQCFRRSALRDLRGGREEILVPIATDRLPVDYRSFSCAGIPECFPNPARHKCSVTSEPSVDARALNYRVLAIRNPTSVRRNPGGAA